MRVVFMGTPQFAVPSLRALAEHHDVVAVYTRADAVSGRGRQTRPSPVSVLGDELGLDVRTPRTLRDEGTVRALADLDADVTVVAAFGLILPGDVLCATRLGAINVHASLLPRWRGAAPIQRAILAGDAVTGVSIMRMEEGLDTGPYCAQASYDLDDVSAEVATQALAQLGAELLIRSLPSIEDGSAVWTTQDATLATYADKVTKADVALSPDLLAEQLVRRVRASTSAAPARLSVAGRNATVISASPAETGLLPGALLCAKDALLLGAADAAVQVIRIKPDGRPEMDACAWARGVRGLGEARWSGVQ